jgi:hypothetical protein
MSGFRSEAEFDRFELHVSVVAGHSAPKTRVNALSPGDPEI